MPYIQKGLTHIVETDDVDPDIVDSILICIEDASKTLKNFDFSKEMQQIVAIIQKLSKLEHGENFASACQSFITVGEKDTKAAEPFSSMVKMMVE